MPNATGTQGSNRPAPASARTHCAQRSRQAAARWRGRDGAIAAGRRRRARRPGPGIAPSAARRVRPAPPRNLSDCRDKLPDASDTASGTKRNIGESCVPSALACLPASKAPGNSGGLRRCLEAHGASWASLGHCVPANDLTYERSFHVQFSALFTERASRFGFALRAGIAIKTRAGSAGICGRATSPVTSAPTRAASSIGCHAGAGMAASSRSSRSGSAALRPGEDLLGPEAGQCAG